MRLLFLTMDGTHGAALRQAAALLNQHYNLDLQLRLYNSTTLRTDDDWQRLAIDIAEADFVFGARLFSEDYVRPLLHALEQATCPVCIITSNPSLIRQTRIGKFVLQKSDEDKEPGFFKQVVSKLRPKGGASEIQRQMWLINNVGKLLKHLPGKARDIHSFISVHQYWLHCSSENLARMLCLLIDRYVPGYKGVLPVQDPILYPDVALLHPDAPTPFTNRTDYEKWQRARRQDASKGRVGLLSLRTIALSGNTAHLDALIAALEARGIEVRMAYSSGLDFRPAIERFYKHGKNGHGAHTDIDLLINGTGFSLVGGPAESRADEARVALNDLDVSYMDLFPLAMQRVEDWQHDDSGLMPLHVTMNVAIPELDGAIEPLVLGGPTAGSDTFVALDDQIDLAASRIARRVALHRKPNAEKKLAVAIFSFPPALGNVGTAAYLDVFHSLYRLLHELHTAGYTVELPESAEALQLALTDGNALLHGTDGNVHARFPVSDYLRLFPYYRDIEPYWGRAPGELLNDGKHFYILGQQFGNIFVGIQPGFGYERDPMRLLMAKDAAPHHGFAAFYTWIEHIFGADAVVHLGTHGALEFMPGKQTGLSTDCWPTRLIGHLPNIYYYSVNNPSEGTIAKRRSAATLVSYMVPPLQQAGLYKGLRLLKDSLERYRQQLVPELLEDIQIQASRLGLGTAQGDSSDPAAYTAALSHELLQIEQRMIPAGLHILGTAPTTEELVDMLALVAAFAQPVADTPPLPHAIASGLGTAYADLRTSLKHDRSAQERWERIDQITHEAMRRFGTGGAAAADDYLYSVADITPGNFEHLWGMLADLSYKITHDGEIEGLLRALRGGYVPPSPGNDVVRNQAVVPTGRNIYGLDPHHIPSAMAQENATDLVAALLERLTAEQGRLPESIAMVLWGIDNLKSDGEGVAQVLALLGARVQLDELGTVSGVELIPLDVLGRPRIDVVVTVSGIFRDLLHHQMTLIDKAARLAATADEPAEQNFVRKHAQAQAAELGISIEEAAVRVFANAPGSYGANVDHLVESSTWDDDQQLSEAFMTRKCFTCAVGGQWRDSRALMERALSTVDATFQNIDSFEVGISDIAQYYENLGGITKSVERLRGERPPVLVADAISTSDRLASLEQMVRLETRAKLLNPKWFEGMLKHGSEGVREIEARVSNTYGWSATTRAVESWVYQGVADTFVLDATMRERLSSLNPHATAAMTRRLLEAHARGYWEADEATLAALYEAYDDLEDRLEGVAVGQ
ncbi:MAG: magnesium chelatase subunit H [Chloroflexaceae bacterium]|nr:magnesium chelatase subunit H [Chloroflexaceae bacterium]